MALLKANKRKKEIDDLFALMQEEDDAYTRKKSAQAAPSKALKTQDAQRVPVAMKQAEPAKPVEEKKQDETFNAALEAIRAMKKRQE